MAVAGDISVCHTDCHEEDCRKTPCDQGCSSDRSARLFPKERDGHRLAQYSAKRIGCCRAARYGASAHERLMCKSIHHMGSDRASCRMRIALGENHRESGATLKARVTWGAVNDSLCTVFSTPAIREGQATRPLGFAVENGIGHVRNPVVSSGILGAFDFSDEVHPNRAALQPCLDGPEWKADHRNFKAVRSLDGATPCS